MQGNVEIDGAYFGGYVKPANRTEDRKDLRKKINQSGKRQSVVVMREREGRTVAVVAAREADARANWMEDCIAGLMINGVSKDRIEIQDRPSKTVIAVDGVPKNEFEFKA